MILGDVPGEIDLKCFHVALYRDNVFFHFYLFEVLLIKDIWTNKNQIQKEISKIPRDILGKMILRNV